MRKGHMVGASLYLHPAALGCPCEHVTFRHILPFSLASVSPSGQHVEHQLYLMFRDAVFSVSAFLQCLENRCTQRGAVSPLREECLPLRTFYGRESPQQWFSELLPTQVSLKSQFELNMALVAKPSCVSFSLQALPNRPLLSSLQSE